MSEIQINDTEKNGGENKAGHIGSVICNCPEWLSKAISELNLYSHDTYGKFRSPNQQVKDLLWQKIQKAMVVFEPSIWKLRKAAKDWVFVTNGEKWSNNNNEAGDNYGSFIEGGLWVLKQIKEAQK